MAFFNINTSHLLWLGHVIIYLSINDIMWRTEEKEKHV